MKRPPLQHYILKHNELATKCVAKFYVHVAQVMVFQQMMEHPLLSLIYR